MIGHSMPDNKALPSVSPKPADDEVQVVVEYLETIADMHPQVNGRDGLWEKDIAPAVLVRLPR